MNNELTSGDHGLHAERVVAKHSRDRGLLVIGLAKLAESLFFFCLGVGAIHFLHKDLDEAATRLATALRFGPEVVNFLLDKVDLIDSHRLRQIGFATFGYSVIKLVEGVGLLLEQVWAEYLTVALTISFLPWELYELVREPNWFRIGLLLSNLAVLVYLIWLLRRMRKVDSAAA